MKFTQKMLSELKQAQKDSSLSRFHRRIQAVYFRAQKKTYKEIKELLDLSHDTVWRLVKMYEKEGLSALITENRGGRRRSYMTIEEEKLSSKNTSTALFKANM
ncbi:hypothetical protein HMPREF9176_0788 [Streptococcus downei F0415]|nr:hypothetical protein HMPREF9176_0788 [Streptococcus downei F0415]